MGVNTTSLNQKDATILTLAGGVVTVLQGLHVIAAQTGTTDDLDTLTVGNPNLTVSGNTYRPLLLITADTGDTITVKHNADNIQLVAGTDIALTPGEWLLLLYDGTNWRDLISASTALDGRYLAVAGDEMAGDLTLADTVNIIADTATGSEIGTAANQKLGFYGATPVVQQTELTDELTQITHTAPGTPDYALQDLIDSGAGSAFGFATKDEGNTVLSVILNLQTRLDELEVKIVALGFLADVD